jgi:hypothetical protein
VAELPGQDLVDAGIRDLAAGEETVESLLVSMARPRLERIGIDVPSGGPERPSHRLYEVLAARDPGTAHSRYNALSRRMVSFARAAEHARAR